MTTTQSIGEKRDLDATNEPTLSTWAIFQGVTGTGITIWGQPGQPIKVTDDSVRFNPKYMELGKFYCVELNKEPYLYRKVSENEVEVYGLAERI